MLFVIHHPENNCNGDGSSLRKMLKPKFDECRLKDYKVRIKFKRNRLGIQEWWASLHILNAIMVQHEMPL